MKTELFSSKYRVLESGNAILYNQDASLKMVVEPGTGFRFMLEISFVDEKDKPRVMHKEVDVEKNEIRLICFNFDSGFGTGSTDPVEIATYNNKRIFLNIWTFLLGNRNGKHTRKIDYTFYIEE